MAKTRQRASLGANGLRPFRRQLDAAVELAIPFEDVERAVRVCLPRLVTDSLTSSMVTGHSAPGSTRQRSGLLRFAGHPEVSSIRRRPGALGHVRWHTRRLLRFFPVMEADLFARPLADGHTELVVDATYQPPGGLLGVVGDALFGWIVARSTIEAFTVHLGEAMMRARWEEHSCTWSYETVGKEMARP